MPFMNAVEVQLLKMYMIIVSPNNAGKAAIVEIETKSYEKESGELLCMNR